MSISITVRPNGATTGGTNQTIPGEGDIDTKEEAEAALTHLPDGSTNGIVVGNRTYTRAQLIEIRDKAAAPASPSNPASPSSPAAPAGAAPADAAPAAAAAGAAAPVAAEGAETVAGDGISHGFYIGGRYDAGLGNKGHSGGELALGYNMGVTLKGEGTQVFLDPGLGLTVGHSSSSYKTPGGEDVSSAFTNYGGELKVHLRVVPNILDRRLFFGGGPSIGIGGFSTADNAIVSTPGNCTPGDFGRQDCEPTAGSQNGNAGTQGLMNFRTGAARSTSGFFLAPGFDLNIGADIVRGDWGKIAGFGSLNISQMVLSPSDGDGFSFTRLVPMLGIRGDFGGGAVPKAPAAASAAAPAALAKPDDDGDGVPNDVDACPNEKGVKSVDPKMNGCPPIHLEFVNPASQFVNSPAYNVKLIGAEKMEGVTYTVEAYSNDGKGTLLGKLDSSSIEGQNFTLLKQYGSDSINTMGIEPFAPELTAEGVKITGDGKAAKGAKPGEFGPHIRYRFTLIGKDKAPLTSYDFYVTKIVVAAGGKARRGAGQR
ncbi:MAG TPA: hypothetical protein VFX30_11385 [bacterium]|nr:hypothetical protein [bacterium]